MPAQYTIDINHQIVKTIFNGVIKSKDIRDLLAQMAKDSSFRSEFSELTIFEDGCNLQLSFLDFKALQSLDPFSRDSKRAIVVGRSRANYGLARMFQAARNDNANLRIFEDLKEALNWLSSKEEQAS